MKTKEAWYIDDGVVVEGILVQTLFRRVFFPRSLGCGFFSQTIYRNDIRKKIFFTEDEAHNAIKLWFDERYENKYTGGTKMNKARRAILTQVCDSLMDLQEEVSGVHDEEEEAMENMPDSLQGTERYDQMEEAVGVLDEAVDIFDELMDKLKEIDGVG